MLQVATNALLERKGERCALVTTKDVKDLLYIGNQARPRIFDLEIKLQDVLYETVVEVDEQVSTQSQNHLQTLLQRFWCEIVFETHEQISAQPVTYQQSLRYAWLVPDFSCVCIK